MGTNAAYQTFMWNPAGKPEYAGTQRSNMTAQQLQEINDFFEIEYAKIGWESDYLRTLSSHFPGYVFALKVHLYEMSISIYVIYAKDGRAYEAPAKIMWPTLKEAIARVMTKELAKD